MRSRMLGATAAFVAAALPAASAGAQDAAPGGSGPQIGFAEQAAGGDAARGLLSGRVDDLNGVESFWVAIRASRRKQGWCLWWSQRLGRLSQHPSACQEPDWMLATIKRTDTGFAWRVRMRGRPPQGHYIVIFRAMNGSGDVERSLADGRRRVGIDVRRGQ